MAGQLGPIRQGLQRLTSVHFSDSGDSPGRVCGQKELVCRARILRILILGSINVSKALSALSLIRGGESEAGDTT
jgi:hypothetical protein